MGCYLMSITFVFLLGSIGTQVVSFLTADMVINRLSPNFHDGIFHRCGAMKYFVTARQYVNSFLGTSVVEGSIIAPDGCYWWNSRLFETDEKSMRAVVVLALISSGVIALVFLFFLINLIDRFRTRGLNMFIAAMLLFNAVLVSGIIIVYTLLYAKDARFYPGPLTPLLFGWSYWSLYGVAGANLFTSLLFCCSAQRHIPHHYI